MRSTFRGRLAPAAVLAFASMAPASAEDSPVSKPPPGRFVRVSDGKEASWDEVVRRARAASVVYVGEKHDDPSDHALQRAVLGALGEANPEVALGMEMFDRTQQAALDRYVEGKTDEAAFLEESHYKEKWGFDWAFYRPLLSYTREHKMRAVGLNFPKELVAKVRKKGLAGLDPTEARSLPAIDLTDEAHRRRVLAVIVAAHPGADAAGKEILDRFYEAMCVWDEVMADGVLGAFLRDRSSKLQVLVVAGSGHIEAGDGVPGRVRRRFPHPSLSIVPMHGRGDEKLEIEGRPIADYVFLKSLPPVSVASPRARTEIAARLDPSKHRIEATASVSVDVDGKGEAWVELGSTLRVKEVLRDGKPVTFEASARSEGLARIRLEPGAALTGSPRYAIRYEGEIHDPPRVAAFSRENTADQTRGTIQEEGVFLSPESGWYPLAPGETGTFLADIRVPAEWDAVSEGSLTTHEANGEGTRVVFDAARPTRGLHLIASKWKRVESEHDGIKVAAYVFPDDADLAEPYIAAVKRYLDLYSKRLGPYAYDRFSVVENFFSTGYGMAGFTVLGKDVMRLPFIVDTSLGHEVAHDWWGNGVFVDDESGNWCEGLTTFVADYAFRRAKSAAEGADYRREVCRDYTNYVGEAASDFPLTSFRGRTTAASRAVGYGKTMMVFSMLESRLGPERFERVLRRVYREKLHATASWETWRAAFSEEAGEDLGWFFDQWVKRPGAPKLALGDVAVRAASSPERAFEARGTLLVEGGEWRLDVPLVFEGEGRSERRKVRVEGARTAVHERLSFRPSVVRVDPEQEVFRRLDDAEVPALLSRALGDKRTLFVLDDASGEALLAAYREVAEPLARGGMGEVVLASRVEPAALAGRSVFLLGRPRPGPLLDLLAELPGEVSLGEDGFSVRGTAYSQPGASLLVTAKRPGDPSRAVALFFGLSPDAVRAAGKKLVHYGKSSYLVFVDGKNVERGVAKVEGGPLVRRLPRWL